MNSKMDYDPVSIASHVFITKYEEKTGTSPNGILFNKYMTLLYRDGNHGGLMKLPHCWYRWGDEVVRYHLRNLEWNHEEAGLTTVGWRGKPPHYDMDDPFVKLAKDYADDFLSKYSAEKGHELAIDEVYRDAPFPFQNEYRKVRENLKEARNWMPENYIQNLLIPMFKEAMRQFPEEFNSISETKERFVKVFLQAAESCAPVTDLFSMIEDFWFFFCYHLRVMCNENVPSCTVRLWEDRIPWESEMYSRNLQSKAFEYAPKSVQDPVIVAILQERVNRISESEEILDMFTQRELDEMKVFFKDFRSGK